MLFSKSINVGIDLGTSEVRVYVEGKGVVVREPSIIAFDNNTKKVLAIGKEAKKISKYNPNVSTIIQPICNGVISDYEMTEVLVNHFLRKFVQSSFLSRPNVLVNVSSKYNDIEKRALQEAIEFAGAKHVKLIPNPLAAAIGAGVDIKDFQARIIVDIGEGTTEISGIALGNILYSENLDTNANTFTEAIISYIRRKYKLLIGKDNATNIKNSMPLHSSGEKIKINGKGIVEDSLETVIIDPKELEVVFQIPIRDIVRSITDIIKKISPEIAIDIIERGIVLTGGGALLSGLCEQIQAKVNVPVILADEPLNTSIIGLGMIIEKPDQFKNLL